MSFQTTYRQIFPMKGLMSAGAGERQRGKCFFYFKASKSDGVNGRFRELCGAGIPNRESRIDLTYQIFLF